MSGLSAAELKAEAARFYVPGVFGYAHVAARLGVSTATVHRWLNPDRAERDRAVSRAYKRRQTGTCRVCGGVTRYNGHGPTRVSTLCHRCNAAENTARTHARIGTGPSQARVLALLADGPKRFMEISTALGWSKGLTSSHLHNLRTRGVIVRLRRGLYALPDET